MLDLGTDLSVRLIVRPAAPEDRTAIDALRRRAIAGLLEPMLPEPERAAYPAHMSLDDRLIADGTYFVAEVDGAIAAAGGWSRRSALVRSEAGQDTPDRILDPARDAAIIRAMYTHPEFARRGLGSLLLATSETAARLAGFRSARVIATPAGKNCSSQEGGTWRSASRWTVPARRPPASAL